MKYALQQEELEGKELCREREVSKQICGKPGLKQVIFLPSFLFFIIYLF
jgi:hypothetical protein